MEEEAQEELGEKPSGAGSLEEQEAGEPSWDTMLPTSPTAHSTQSQARDRS